MQRNAAHTQAPAGTSAPNAQTMVGADVLDAPAVAQQTLDRTVADRPVEVDGPATPSMAAQGSGDSTAPTADRVLRYEPLRPLGEGGMGEVLLSRDRTIGRDVAVKRLKSLPGGGQAAAKDFLDEVRTTGRLEHPGIVPIYDAGWDKDGAPYFVMKYVEGEPLEQIIAKLRAGDPDYQHRFSFEVRTQIFMQLLHAMQYAHRRGVLHLDIKPANVLVGRFGEVVLVDWGIARAHAHAQAQAHSGENAATAPNGTDGAVVAGHRGRSAAISITGTPDYMSPEQAMGRVEDFGPHTDTYCLCVLFYELITLHHYLPPRETLEGRLTSILVDEPLSGIQMHHRYGSPPELSNYVRAGLGKEITDRYRTVDEMVDKLQAVIDGDIPVACPCTGIKRAANGYGDFMNDHPNLAIAGVVITSVFAVVGLVDVFRWVAAHI